MNPEPPDASMTLGDSSSVALFLPWAPAPSAVPQTTVCFFVVYNAKLP